MANFKVIFILGHNNADVYNDNIDINIILPNRDVYFGTLVTINNMQYLMEKDKSSYFWVVDMFVLRDLKKETIREAVQGAIEDNTFEDIFCKIGTLDSHYIEFTYDSLPDMNDTIDEHLR